LAGTDVIHSEAFDLMGLAMVGVTAGTRNFKVNATLRRLSLLYVDKHDALDVSVDRFGNYTVWASDEGANLALLMDMVHRLRKRQLLVDETNFPVRNRAEVPRL
jgi:hypothetical protein